MAVRVDQPGDERLALAVLLEIGAFGALVLAVEQLLHLAVGADDEAGEAHELAVLVERDAVDVIDERSEEHTSELQSLMRISYAVFCLKKKQLTNTPTRHTSQQA